jgi:FtsP/CotA-like multicopper oxidase with cupredoxin domain
VPAGVRKPPMNETAEISSPISVISRNGTPTILREWRDTVLLSPRERVGIAFVADNPGDWMFHCHILEHQESGMMGVIRVA